MIFFVYIESRLGFGYGGEFICFEVELTGRDRKGEPRAGKYAGTRANDVKRQLSAP